MFVEDYYPAHLVAEQFGISEYSVYCWGKRYLQYGRQGLVNQPKKQPGSEMLAAVKQSIIDLKKKNPARKARLISDTLKRFYIVGVSAPTVQRMLKSQGLTHPVRKERKKNLAKPRSFERATPNQMWQNDIMTFRLSGKNA